MRRYVGYRIAWGKEPDSKLMDEMTDLEGWIYPNGMIERLFYLDRECMIFHFPSSMTFEEIRNYKPYILDEQHGYELIEEM